jgi:TIGR00730 family protein
MTYLKKALPFLSKSFAKNLAETKKSTENSGLMRETLPLRKFDRMKKICVFCGSSMGFSEQYKEKAAKLADELINNQCELLYGGGSVGLMKIIADVMMQKGGKVIGIMPTHLLKLEVGHCGISQMIEVNSMAERKTKLEEMADAFIAMPGGIGTLDELSEVAVLSQLRIIDKPLALYNTNGYYDTFITFLNHGVNEGFIRKEHVENIIVSADAKEIMEKIQAFKPISVRKWLNDIHEESGNNLK